jgi:antitoxin MazE
MNIMEVSVIQIGNSKGIRFSKTLLEKYNIKEKVNLILEKEKIIIEPISTPRKGWEESFKKMNENGDDRLLLNDVFEDETLEEWN